MLKGKTMFFLLLFTFFIYPAASVFSQTQLTVPQVSQAATVSQTIGLTKITVDYHRPLVKGRKIWGDLVPFNEVWRAGANENTTIEFSDPVKINGMDLPAGKYGLHTIPTENEWTIIFNRNNGAWGSFFYDQSLDQLRIKVKPRAGSFEEALTYYFSDPTAGSVNVVLHWEKLIIEFKVDIDVKEFVFKNMMQELTNLPGFFWQGYSQAALYCLQNNFHLDEGIKLIETSIGKNKNFTNLRVKSGLLEKTGHKTEASEILAEANSIATEAEINALGYQYLNAKNLDKAIETFKLNVKNHPESWNVYDSIAEAYMADGNRDLALENYKKALKMVKDTANKDRLEKTVKKLQY